MDCGVHDPISWAGKAEALGYRMLPYIFGKDGKTLSAPVRACVHVQAEISGVTPDEGAVANIVCRYAAMLMFFDIANKRQPKDVP